MANLEMFYQMT